MEHKAKMKLSRLHFPRNKIALGIKAVTIILTTIAIYFPDLTTVANEAIRSKLMSHIIAKPPPAHLLTIPQMKNAPGSNSP